MDMFWIGYIFGFSAGSTITLIIAYTYVMVTLKKFGWSWKAIVGKIAKDKLEILYDKEEQKHE